MRAADVIGLSARSLARRRLRSVLTTFGIFVGIVTIVAMVALAAGVQQEIGRNVAELGLDIIRATPRTEQTGLPNALVQAPRVKPITRVAVDDLRRLPGVVSVNPMVSIPLAIDMRVVLDGKEVRVVPASSTRPPFGPILINMVAGRSVEDRPTGVVLSKNALTRLGITEQEAIERLIGKPITIVGRTPRGETQEFQVAVEGVDDATRPEVSFAAESAAAVLNWWYDEPDILATQGYDSVIIRAASLGIVPAVSEAITARGFQVNSTQAILDVINKVFAVLQAMLAAVGGLALFVASLGVVNTMLMAVYERTREIGIMKATGASRWDVLRLFLFEAGMMGAIGGATGLLGGWLLSLLVDWIAHVYMETQQITFVGSLSYVPVWLAAGSLLFALMIGIVAGLYPAYRAASLDPVAALRHD